MSCVGGWIEIHQVDGPVLDVPPHDVQVIAVVEEVPVSHVARTPTLIALTWARHRHYSPVSWSGARH